MLLYKMTEDFLNCYPRSNENMYGLINGAIKELKLSKLNILNTATLMLTIAKTESNCEWTAQRLSSGKKGAARGLWQFEKTGIKGVLLHNRTMYKAINVCERHKLDLTFDINGNVNKIWNRLETDDLLAACFARLLLLTDSRPLPNYTECEASYRYYLDLWRPGKPIQLYDWSIYQEQCSEWLYNRFYG